MTNTKILVDDTSPFGTYAGNARFARLLADAWISVAAI